MDRPTLASALMGVEDDPIAKRGTFLPFVERKSGKAEIGLPSFLKEPWDALQRLNAGGYQPGTGDEQGVKDSATLAGALMMGGLGLNWAGQVPKGALGSAGGKLPTQGIRAYHGSPHDFDKFDSTKIGTGEGAQAYGHGLYFAENEGVARSYRDQLGDYSGAAKWKGDQPPTPLQQKFLQQLGGPDAASGQPMTVDMLKGEYARRIRNEEAAAEGMYGIKIPEAADRAKQLRQDLEELNRVADKIEVAPPSGRMYEVRINADPDQFLDWDKPLSQQSEAVRKALEPSIQELREKMIADASKWGTPSAQELAGYRRQADEIIGRMRGQEVHDALDKRGFKAGQPWTYNETATSNQFRDAGIPGIKYLDQGSRAGGEGTRNYVVFDADKIEILKKYGWVPVGMVGGGMMMAPPTDEGTGF